MEIRSFNSVAPELRYAPGGAMPIVVGYGAVFGEYSQPLNDVGRGSPYREIIVQGAFLRSLMAAATGEHDVLARFDHQGVLARTSSGTLRLNEDARGLRYEFQLPDTSLGRDVAELIRRGDVKGSSFAFQPVRQSWRSEGKQRVRELQEVRLLDVSVVINPAYPATNAKLWLQGELGRMQMALDLAKRK